MNQMRMDAEGGGRLIHRSRRAGMLTVLVAVQNLLVFACLVATLYVYRDCRSLETEDIVHIQFDGFSGAMGNQTLKLSGEYNTHMMEVGKTNETIRIQCTGPYILYMEVCYENGKSTGTLQLQVKERKDPVHSFKLDSTQTVCRRLHSTVYLKANEEASVYMHTSEKFHLHNITMGLSYLLGSKCDY